MRATSPSFSMRSVRRVTLLRETTAWRARSAMRQAAVFRALQDPPARRTRQARQPGLGEGCLDALEQQRLA